MAHCGANVGHAGVVFKKIMYGQPRLEIPKKLHKPKKLKEIGLCFVCEMLLYS